MKAKSTKALEMVMASSLLKNIHSKVYYLIIGNFNMGKKDGKGIINFLNGEIYDGHFKDDYKSGQGYIKYPSGNSYDG